VFSAKRLAQLAVAVCACLVDGREHASAAALAPGPIAHVPHSLGQRWLQGSQKMFNFGMLVNI